MQKRQLLGLVLFLGSFPVMLTAAVLHDPMRPTYVKQSPLQEAFVNQSGLTSIIYARKPKDRKALLNGVWVPFKGFFRNQQVVDITQNSVTLDSGGKFQTVLFLSIDPKK